MQDFQSYLEGWPRAAVEHVSSVPLVPPYVPGVVHVHEVASRNDTLPTQQDFDPSGSNPDAQVAWYNFGGLTVQQATEKLRDAPLHYQHDFMFMGGRAFAYYFPAIGNHLRTASDINNDGDHAAWILAHCIRAQFYGSNLPHVLQLATSVRELAGFVCDNIHQFGDDDGERQRVAAAWSDLVRYVEAVV